MMQFWPGRVDQNRYGWMEDRSADATEDELEIPLDCAVASVGQSPR
jgi:hypothetical protein